MKKYKVEFIQTETFIVDILAKDKKDAIEKATSEFILEQFPQDKYTCRHSPQSDAYREHKGEN